MHKAPYLSYAWYLAASTCFLLLATPSQAQTVGGETETVFRWNGRAAEEHFGGSTAAAGDINADGTMDIMVAAYQASPGGLSNAGSVFIFSGADGSVLFQINGLYEDDYFGTAVSAMGDLNQDGFDDFLIAALGADPNGITDAGSATLYSGMNGSILLQINGQIANGNLGSSGSSVGDLDGDGLQDIVLGSPGAHAAAAYSSATGAVLHQWSGFAGAPHPRFGISVDNAGDTNNDGFDDIVIGDDFVGNGGAGAAYLYSGNTGLLLHKWNGDRGDGLGRSLAGVGDLDQDGFDDVLVGAPWGEALGESSAGKAMVYSGATGLTLMQWSGDSSFDGLGYSTALAGDVNGDGFPDIILGSYYQNYAKVYSGENGALLFTYVGESEDSRLGHSAAALGDLNNDGRDDVLVSAVLNEVGGLDHVGSAFVFSFQPILEASTPIVSVSAGGTVDLSIQFPDIYAGQSYATLLSASGEGRLQRGVGIPLIADNFTLQSLQGNYPTGTHQALHGVLDVLGGANASISFPAGMPPSLIGRNLWFATITHALGELPNSSSVAVKLEMIP